MKSNCVVYAAALAALFCALLSFSDAVPVHNRNRSTRGFKNAALSTARGFGKRAELGDHRDIIIDRDINGLDGILREKAYTNSYPGEWFAEELATNPELAAMVTSHLSEELLNNPEFARKLTSKIIDQNHDGELSYEELLRSTY